MQQGYPPQQQQEQLQAQYYQPAYPGQMQYAQGGYVQGVPINQQQYQQNQYYGYNQQPYLVQAPQQMVVVQMVQPLDEKILFEERLRNASRWFTGCNSIWAIFILINLITRSIELFGKDSSASQTAGVFIIIENILWLASIAVGIYGITNFIEKHLKYYQIGLAIVMGLEIIASIIIFSDFETHEGGNKVFFVIMFILTLLCLASFIHNARQLRQAIVLWQALQTNPINNNNNNNNNEGQQQQFNNIQYD